MVSSSKIEMPNKKIGNGSLSDAASQIRRTETHATNMVKVKIKTIAGYKGSEGE
jgi:hypothetical protein